MRPRTLKIVREILTEGYGSIMDSDVPWLLSDPSTRERKVVIESVGQRFVLPLYCSLFAIEWAELEGELVDIQFTHEEYNSLLRECKQYA